MAAYFLFNTSERGGSSEANMLVSEMVVVKMLTTAGTMEITVEPYLMIVIVCSGTKVVVIPGSENAVVIPSA